MTYNLTGWYLKLNENMMLLAEKKKMDEKNVSNFLDVIMSKYQFSSLPM